MEPVEHRSADGLLTLVVSRDNDDVTIGFKGHAWHTHGDILAARYPFGEVDGLTPETAAARFVDDLVGNRVVIVVQRIREEVRDVWVTEDVDRELRHKDDDETLEFRHWDGGAVHPSAG